MSGAAFRASYDRLIRRAGGGATVTIRRRNTLQNSAQGAPLVALAMAGAALAGATTISLDAPNLSGVLRAGSRFQIAGVAGTYTSQSDVETSAGALSVSISPALAGNAADNAAVTITQAFGDYTFAASRAREAAATGKKAAALLGRVRYHLSAVGASTAPVPGDLLIAPDGATERIGRVAPRRPGSLAHGWVVELGEMEVAA